jgi:hypothetical protein
MRPEMWALGSLLPYIFADRASHGAFADRHKQKKRFLFITDFYAMPNLFNNLYIFSSKN